MTELPGEITWDERLIRLRASSARVADIVAGLDDASWLEASELPTWSRAHVAAHLALNAEGLVRAVASAGTSEPLPVYDSDDARADAIEELATSSVAEVVSRIVAADADLVELLVDLPDEQRRTGSAPRTPGGPLFLFAELPTTRRRELEVHVIDLGAGASRSGWSADFVVELVDRTTWDRFDDGPFAIHATDLDRSWQIGEPGGLRIEGRGAELAWWLTGRDGADLDGELPSLSPWTRRPGP